MKSESARASVDTMLEVLSHVQRRKLLLALLEENSQGVLSGDMVGSDSCGPALDESVRMKHAHLPKLAEYGFIEWHRETNEVRKGEQFEEIRPLLELLDDHREKLPSDWV